MKKKLYSLLFIIFNFLGIINAQNIEFTNHILKSYLLSSSPENEVAKDINGKPMAIDANGDGEISLQEALNTYQLKVGINNIYPEKYPTYPDQSEVGSFDLTYFKNIRVLKYNGTVPPTSSIRFPRSLNATGFTHLEELYFLDGHYFYKEYPFHVELPEYLPYLKIVDAPIKTSYSQAPNLEDLNCLYTYLGNSGSSGMKIIYEKLNFSNFKNLKKITANADTIIIKNLPSLKDTNIDGEYYYYLENLPQIKTLSIKSSRHPVLKKLSSLKSLDCKNELSSIDPVYTRIKKLELEDLPELTSIDCSNNLLVSLDLSKNIPKLSKLIFRNNKIETINISNNILLDTLDLSNNLLTEINVNKNKQLKKLDIFHNFNIRNLDISNNALIEDLNIARTGLSYINLSKQINLKSLISCANYISTLDLSNNPLVSNLLLIDQGQYDDYTITPNLKYLIIKNNVTDSWIKDTKMNYLKPGLESICCDNQEEIDLIYKYFVGDRYKESINITTNCNQSLFHSEEIQASSSVTLYPNPTTDFLYINTQEKITKVEIFDSNGRLLISENITSPKVTVSELPQGSYFITLHYAKGKINKQFIKN